MVLNVKIHSSDYPPEFNFIFFAFFGRIISAILGQMPKCSPTLRKRGFENEPPKKKTPIWCYLLCVLNVHNSGLEFFWTILAKIWTYDAQKACQMLSCVSFDHLECPPLCKNQYRGENQQKTVKICSKLLKILKIHQIYLPEIAISGK